MARFVPPELIVTPIAAGPAVEVWRAVATDDRESDAYVRSFMSSHERGKPMIPDSAEEVYRAIHMGISAFQECANAAWVAERFALGDFVAQLRLEPGKGFSYARWGANGHLTIWGDAVKLAASAVDIRSLDC